MAEHAYFGNDRLLGLREAAGILGDGTGDVLAAAAGGHITWTVVSRLRHFPDGTAAWGQETMYPEGPVRALAARRNTPPPDRLISRAEAARILGVGSSSASKLLTRDPAAAGSRSYRLSAVLMLKAERDGKRRTLSPEHRAAFHAGRDAAPGWAEPSALLTAAELARAQAAHRARTGGAS